MERYPIPFPGAPGHMTLPEFVHMMNDHTVWHFPPAERRIRGSSPTEGS